MRYEAPKFSSHLRDHMDVGTPDCVGNTIGETKAHLDRAVDIYLASFASFARDLLPGSAALTPFLSTSLSPHRSPLSRASSSLAPCTNSVPDTNFVLSRKPFGLCSC